MKFFPLCEIVFMVTANFDNYICSAKNACDSIVIESKKQEDLFLKSFSMYKKHRYQNLFNQCLDLKVCLNDVVQCKISNYLSCGFNFVLYANR